MHIRLVIPCYNEAARFPRALYERSLEQLPDLSLLFVDDGSSDATAALLRDFCASHASRCELMSLGQNNGKGEAVRQGMLRAATGSADYLGYFDADLAIPLVEAFNFFVFLQARRPAYILSARVKLLGTTSIDRQFYRHILGRTFATLVSMAMGLAVYDTQCGAKLVRADVVRPLFDHPFMSRWLFDVELLYRCRVLFGPEHLEEHVAEVPIRRLEDPGGTTLTLARALSLPFELLRLQRAYRNHHRANH